MPRQNDTRPGSRFVPLAGLALALGAPVALGAMMVHLGGFYPDTALAAALRTSGLVLAVVPVAVVALDARRRR